MGGHQHPSYGYKPECLKLFKNKYLILTHYMISAWWMNFMEGLGQYIIRPGAFEKVIVMATIIMDLVYTYNIIILKPPPDIVITIIHFGRQTTCTT